MNIVNQIIDTARSFSAICDFDKLSAVILSLGLLFGSFSVAVRTAVWGFPKKSFFMLSFFFLSFVLLFALSYCDFTGLQLRFKSFKDSFVYSLFTVGVSIILYLLFYFSAGFLATESVKEVEFEKRTAVTKAMPVAFLSETPILFEKEEGAIKLYSEKLTALKPRLDDKLDFFRAEKYVENLKKTSLTNLERAELLRAERTLKHYKNTPPSYFSRSALNSAFETLVRLSSKRVKGEF